MTCNSRIERLLQPSSHFGVYSSCFQKVLRARSVLAPCFKLPSVDSSLASEADAFCNIYQGFAGPD